MSLTRDEGSALDDVLLTPPTTDLDTGTWDDEGPIRGWRLDMGPRHGEMDFVIEQEFEAHGCACLLVRVTDLIVLGRHRAPDRVGESETFYRGYVYAPEVESLPKGCFGTRIVDCDARDGWFVWDERTWSNGYSYTKSVSEHARYKTERLAKAAQQRREGSL